MTDSARFSWTVLLPVKVLARAKSRLAVLAGDRRRELALALAPDTVAAVLACPEVARVLVVTSDPVAGRCSRRSARSSCPTSRPAGDSPRQPGPRLGDLAARPETAQRGAAARRRGGGAPLAGHRARRAHRRPARAAPRRARRGAARRGRRGRPARRSCRTRPASARRCTRSRPAVTSARCSAGRQGHGTRRQAPPSSTSTAWRDCAGTWTRQKTSRSSSRLGPGPRTTALAGELLADV